MSLVLRRSLIFFALLLGGLVLYSFWYGIKADRYEATAIPYLETAIPEITIAMSSKDECPATNV